ncbi:HNH endonuclease signature motif containing protein [Mycobacteroides abscessus]|uniref:HNH endonuclease signature motif containing protein n=1 Tax=Mycobacteroides abscessus TaxID=36809 RepID=UPI0009A8E3FA|nr:HNH endonuclease signature motif containing protein [Mycobacteroides abscessus]
MRRCRACGALLSRRSQKTFCGNACQATARRDASIRLWLQSGEARVRSEQSHFIRLFLTEAQSDRCAICGGASSWQGSPLVFVLDHVDGNPANNCRDNLRLVCPNCDSQLPTYKSRNRGNGRSSRRRRYADGKSY